MRLREGLQRSCSEFVWTFCWQVRRDGQGVLLRREQLLSPVLPLDAVCDEDDSGDNLVG